jgi:glycosyltransferase involved in cell wall biosynthesis
MLPGSLKRPRRVLMTLDAVGGVWRYAVDLSRALEQDGIRCMLVGFGPRPDAAHLSEVRQAGGSVLAWSDLPLDWMVDDECDVDAVSDKLTALAHEWQADLLHLNVPSQAAGLPPHLKVVVASHSCVSTWWNAVRGGELPQEWAWQQQRTKAGLLRADLVIVPSASHRSALHRAYGREIGAVVVPNATRPPTGSPAKEEFVLSAGRWWDEGKNGAILDQAARASPWPVVMAGPLRGPNGQGLELRNAVAAGELPGDAARDLIARAAIFAAPSLYEPFGLAVLEAAARRCALVLADIPTFRELWEGVALFAPAGEAGAFAAAIGRLALDEGLRSRLGALAYRRAASFTPARQRKLILRAYSNAIDSRQTVRMVA